jgi:hypothetical protein
MGSYLVGIGGTGAKTVEAVTRLCAAGLGPAELDVTFVDPDQANGNVERATQALEEYRSCRGTDASVPWGGAGLLKTVMTGGELWTPFHDQNQPVLRDFLEHPNLAAQAPEVARLLDVLYSDREMTTTLDKGFRGHPSIGSAVMASRVDFEGSPVFEAFRQQVQQDVGAGEMARIVLVGSIFGGTGAAGFPTIARLIRDQLEELGPEYARLGGVLVLPYFSFNTPGQNQELAAASEQFLLSTQAALEFYYESEYHDIYDSLHVVGDSQLSEVPTFALGAGLQQNDPHVVELYAALGALDMFNGTTEGQAPVSMLARQQGDRFDWEDLPDGNTVKPALAQLARFCTVFTHFYHPLLEDLRDSGKTYRAPWFADLVGRAGVDVHDAATTETLGALRTLCRGVLGWWEGVHKSTNGVHLLDCDVFAPKFRPGQMESLVRPEAQSRYDVTGVWDRLCTTRYRSAEPGTRGIGTFLRALYDACG